MCVCVCVQGTAPEFVPLIDELKRSYRTKIRPLEDAYKFSDFHSNALTDTDFDAKPMVLLLGQYSTGKSAYTSHCTATMRPL